MGHRIDPSELIQGDAAESDAGWPRAPAISFTDPLPSLLSLLTATYGRAAILAALGGPSSPATPPTPAQIAALPAEELAVNGVVGQLYARVARLEHDLYTAQAAARVAPPPPDPTADFVPIKLLRKRALPNCPSYQAVWTWAAEQEPLGFAITLRGQRNGVRMCPQKFAELLEAWRLNNPNGPRKNKRRN